MRLEERGRLSEFSEFYSTTAPLIARVFLGLLRHLP